MRYQKVGKTELELSALSVGTWAIGGAQYGDVNEKDSIAAIRTMIDRGVTLVDTAPIYGNGHSEEVVGRALAGGYRGKVALATKFGVLNGFVKDGSYKNALRECEDSLWRLQTDVIDIYIMHWPDPNTPVEEGISAAAELQRQGKVRYIGVSNFSQEQIERAQKVATIDILQPPFSMVNQSAVELMRWCEGQGIGTMTYGSLGAGILTGAIRTMPTFAPDDMRNIFYDYFKEPKFSHIIELLRAMDGIADKRHKPLAQIAINWATQKSFVTTAISAVRNPQEPNENCDAFDWSLSDAEMALLDAELLRLDIH
jgi:aryl-alcohol dehydrogenase-like predicted oxidoreductase